ncbi:MAG: HAMP domain-containing histidine kinase [Betaproteobacteria bacterium]|nr:HAMP domain-containing histidine kinase [Betaproteobacteria bacterium]
MMSFSRRVVVAFALLLLAFSVLVAVLGRHLGAQYELEMQQRLSHGLARHIVGHWPQVSKPAQGEHEREALDEVLRMLMVVNPAIEVYTLDEDGRVRNYLGKPGSVRTMQVDVETVRAFLAGAPLPLLGTDPKSPHARKIFSAAMFPAIPGKPMPAGYLYVILDGEARAQVSGSLDAWPLLRTSLLVAALGLALTLLVGVMTFRNLTRPLRQLAVRMRNFSVGADERAAPATERAERGEHGDEVAAIAHSFDTMAARIEHHARARAEQQAAHREVIASVAHDLRTPLTALHGYLETLNQNAAAIDGGERKRYLDAALGQSDKVRRLSQQLFELARLQSSDQILQCERFNLDELVNDAVQKFGLLTQPAPAVLHGASPGCVEVEGDLQLIDRALTNLIDNAIRHAEGATPVRVSLACDGARATVLVEDNGPGLPQELARRLDAGEPVREPPARRGGGFGGLGLAIAQRIALLHGGSLHTLPAPDGGTRLCLALPVGAAANAAPGSSST